MFCYFSILDFKSDELVRLFNIILKNLKCFSKALAFVRISAPEKL